MNGATKQRDTHGNLVQSLGKPCSQWFPLPRYEQIGVVEGTFSVGGCNLIPGGGQQKQFTGP